MPLQEASIPPLGEQRFDQNWANRSLLGAGFQKTGRGKRRKYSLEDCLVLALTLRLRNAGFSASEAFECVSKQWSQKASLATLAYNAVHQLVRAGRVWPVVLVEITNFQEPTAGLIQSILTHELNEPTFEIDILTRVCAKAATTRWFSLTSPRSPAESWTAGEAWCASFLTARFGATAKPLADVRGSELSQALQPPAAVLIQLQLVVNGCLGDAQRGGLYRSYLSEQAALPFVHGQTVAWGP